MKTLTRIKVFILAMVMTMGTLGTTAFAAETRNNNTVVKGDVVSSEVLSDGMIATTVEYQIADSLENSILEVPDSAITPRLWEQSWLYDFESGNTDGKVHYFSDGNYLGFELSVRSTNGYTQDQTVTATLYRDTLVGGTALGSAVGHTINTSSNQKADWISISNNKAYYWNFKSSDVSKAHPVDVLVTYYTWN